MSVGVAWVHMCTIAFDHYRRVAPSLLVCFSVAMGAAALVGAMIAPARAEESAQQAALSQQQRMRVLEARLQYLEEKLARVERETADAAGKRAQSDDKSKGKKSKTNGAVSGNIPASTSPSTSTATSQTPASVAADAVKESPAQETFVFREQSPTLKKGQVETSLDFNYIHSSGFLQIDRIATQAATLRYGVIDGLEISASLPHYDSVRTTNLGPGLQYEGKVDAIGSATVGLSYSLLNQTPDWPGLAVSVTGIYPGQVSPYGTYGPSFSPGQNPIDILRSVQSSGHWGIGANLVAYKIVDPLMVFVGGGPTYFFPTTFGLYSVEPAIRYSANVGFSFALSEKITLAFQALGFYQPDLKISGIVSPQSYQEQFVGRGALTVRVFDNTWVEPSLAIGLTKESPAMNLGLTLRKRW